MSIPERIWRLVRGRWLLAEEQVRDALAEEAAAQELAESSRLPPLASPPRPLSPGRGSVARRSHLPAAGRKEDPLAADLALLGAPPASDMATLDRVYAERLAELQSERFAAG